MPEAALLGMGAECERQCADKGTKVARKVFHPKWVVVTDDSTVIDGARLEVSSSLHNGVNCYHRVGVQSVISLSNAEKFSGEKEKGRTTGPALSHKHT